MIVADPGQAQVRGGLLQILVELEQRSHVRHSAGSYRRRPGNRDRGKVPDSRGAFESEFLEDVIVHIGRVIPQEVLLEANAHVQ